MNTNDLFERNIGLCDDIAFYAILLDVVLKEPITLVNYSPNF
ncbi:hypothetical protein Nizo1839_2345 [Lactiplantibacillus plantarum]|nr:hypothetical protein SF2A35B_1003 [Lactiplantibacillus plantarum]KZT79043.1 hypothetical protein Nizo1839_2345 [Lactiplantibacillus plantarum]KZU16050.1 hypothetical protein Nizo2264_0180 [Lactiplantibacillus plantarum]